ARRLKEQLGHDVPVASTRAGHIPGVHRVAFDSSADHITLTHTARSRESFADGALLAARWLVTTQRRGVFALADVLYEMLAMQRTRGEPVSPNAWSGSEDAERRS